MNEVLSRGEFKAALRGPEYVYVVFKIVAVIFVYGGGTVGESRSEFKHVIARLDGEAGDEGGEVEGCAA